MKEFRLVLMLATCQLLWVSAGAVILTLSGIVGNELAVNKSFSTLPFALMCLTDSIFSIPASMLMLRIGRRKGFLLGALVGCASGVVGTAAIVTESFALFCVGVALWGLSSSFGQFYRYAAAEGVRPALSSRAISAVVASGVIAVFVGPEIAVLSQNVVSTAQFAGSFLAMAGLCVIALMLISFLRLPQPAKSEALKEGPRHVGWWQPTIATGLVNGAVSYAMMVFVMTATHLAAVHVGHSVSDAASAIQWHLFGMYAPSLATGWLIYRLGEVKIMLVGLALLLVSLVTSLSGTSIYHFWVALLMLGAGWNMMFVSSSVLLSAPKDASVRAKVQAAGEFASNATVTIAAFSAGTVFVQSGWTMVNIIALPFLFLSFLVTVRYALSRKFGKAGDRSVAHESLETTPGNLP